ncbi:hypothetical protein M7I_2498 [Glarea lozoyensis 74030]|uniref:Uncharacterized protein n=1 Tax=Glarea lozoyensis (strain ATCC 74030 / MF5533) TaxID=1104152 RepID=H0EIX8_GLAL7|nr:hypothetical protein M7I_2498 [Glarea lozoyensis 74030]
MLSPHESKRKPIVLGTRKSNCYSNPCDIDNDNFISNIEPYHLCDADCHYSDQHHFTTVIQYTFPPDRRRAADLGTGGEVPNPSSADMTKIERRQVTVVPSIVPTYASACSGSLRLYNYCSAYSLLGERQLWI